MKESLKENKSDISSAKWIGISYFLIIFLALIRNVVIKPIWYVEGSIYETIFKIQSQEIYFRLGIISDTLSYIAVLMVSFFLKEFFRDTNNRLTSLAYSFRFAEGILGFLWISISGLLPLGLVHSFGALGGIAIHQFSFDLMNSILEFYESAISLVMILMSIGALIFFYLFYISSKIPKWISVWGLVTYAIMLTFSFSILGFPKISEIISMIVYSHGSIFELFFGIYMMFVYRDSNNNISS